MVVPALHRNLVLHSRAGACPAGESLRRRLPGTSELAQELLSRAVDPWEHRDAASQSSAGISTPPAEELSEVLCVEVASPQHRSLLDWLLCNESGSPPGAEARAVTGGSGTTWAAPIRLELAVHVPSTVNSQFGGGTDSASLCSRSYILQIGERESRLATVCVADDC